MDEFNRRLQTFFMMKDQEYGKLCYLSSRITPESETYIDAICTFVTESCRLYDIPVERKDLDSIPECINVYKYLVLNTNFKSQEYLMEDIIHGHLVDMFPPLSPYLLCEILWKLHYEDLLACSIPYVPLDLAVEFIEAARRCIDMLHFERALKIIFKLITKCYEKIILVEDVGTQTTNVHMNLENLVVNVQELLTLLLSEKGLKFQEATQAAKIEQSGIIIKNVLDMIDICLNCNKQNILKHHLEKLYTMTFGRMPRVKCDTNLAHQYLGTLRQEMANLLLRKVKNVDCNCYMGWVEVNDMENRSISLQKAIGIRCYKLIEDAKNDERLKDFSHLMECLQQLSSKPEPGEKSILSLVPLQDVVNGVIEGKKEYVKEIIKRYKDWDDTVFDQVEKQSSLIDKEDCLTLLDYVVSVRTGSYENSFKQNVCLGTMSILLRYQIVDMMSIILEYLINYNGNNILESVETESHLKNFIAQNPNFEIMSDFKKVLLFIMKNPKKVLQMLIKASIGHHDFRHVMLSMKDLFLLSSFMTIKDSENNYLLLTALRDACMENVEWNDKQFKELLANALNTTCISANDILRTVFAPYLAGNSYSPACLKTILICISKLLYECPRNVDNGRILQGLAKTLSQARKDKIHSRFDNCEVIHLILKLIKTESVRVAESARYFWIGRIEPYLEPLNRTYFEFLWTSKNQICEYNTYTPRRHDIEYTQLVRHYERRCFYMIQKVVASKRLPAELRGYVSNFSFLVEDFLRHAILRCVKKEFFLLGMDLVVNHYKIFNWQSPYDPFCRITFEALQLCLEFPEDFPLHSFPFLLKCCGTFWNSFSPDQDEIEDCCKAFVEGFTSLDKSIRNTPFADLYEVAIRDVQNTTNIPQLHLEVFSWTTNRVISFAQDCIDKCLDATYKYSGSHNAKVLRYRVTHEFINACMLVTGVEMVDCFTKINQILFPATLYSV